MQIPLEETSFEEHDVKLNRGLKVAVIVEAYRQFMNALPENVLIANKVLFLINQNMNWSIHTSFFLLRILPQLVFT